MPEPSITVPVQTLPSQPLPSVEATSRRGVAPEAVQYLNDLLKQPGFLQTIRAAFPQWSGAKIVVSEISGKGSIRVDAKTSSTLRWEVVATNKSTSTTTKKVSGFAGVALPSEVPVIESDLSVQFGASLGIKDLKDRTQIDRLNAIGKVVGQILVGFTVDEARFVSLVGDFVKQLARSGALGSLLCTRAQEYGAAHLSNWSAEQLPLNIRANTSTEIVAWSRACRDVLGFTLGYDFTSTMAELGRAGSTAYWNIRDNPARTATDLRDLCDVLTTFHGLLALSLPAPSYEYTLAGRNSRSSITAILKNLAAAFGDNISLGLRHPRTDGGTNAVEVTEGLRKLDRILVVICSEATASGALGLQTPNLLIPATHLTAVGETRRLIAQHIYDGEKNAAVVTPVSALPILEASRIESAFVELAAGFVACDGSEPETSRKADQLLGHCLSLYRDDSLGLSTLRQSITDRMADSAAKSKFWASVSATISTIATGTYRHDEHSPFVREVAEFMTASVVRDIGRNASDKPVTEERFSTMEQAFELYAHLAQANKPNTRFQPLIADCFVEGASKLARTKAAEGAIDVLVTLERKASAVAIRFEASPKTKELPGELQRLTEQAVAVRVAPVATALKGVCAEGDWSSASSIACKAIVDVGDLAYGTDGGASLPPTMVNGLSAGVKRALVDPMLNAALQDIKAASDTSVNDRLSAIGELNKTLGSYPGLPTVLPELTLIENQLLNRLQSNVLQEVLDNAANLDWIKVADSILLFSSASDRLITSSAKTAAAERILAVRTKVTVLFQSRAEEVSLKLRTANEPLATEVLMAAMDELRTIEQTRARLEIPGEPQSDRLASNYLARIAEGSLKAALGNKDRESAVAECKTLVELHSRIGGTFPKTFATQVEELVFEDCLKKLANCTADDAVLLVREHHEVIQTVGPYTGEQSHVRKIETVDNRGHLRVMSTLGSKVIASCPAEGPIGVEHILAFMEAWDSFVTTFTGEAGQSTFLDVVRTKSVAAVAESMLVKLSPLLDAARPLKSRGIDTWKVASPEQITRDTIRNHEFMRAATNTGFVAYLMAHVRGSLDDSLMRYFRRLEATLTACCACVHPHIVLPIEPNHGLGSAAAYLEEIATGSLSPEQIDEHWSTNYGLALPEIGLAINLLSVAFPGDPNVRPVLRTLCGYFENVLQILETDFTRPDIANIRTFIPELDESTPNANEGLADYS